MTIPFNQRGRAARSAVRPSPIFLAVLATALVSGYYVWQAGNQASRSVQFGAFVFIVSAWVVTLCLHEFAHAFLAWRFGDHEVEARGYLTLNPLKYSHPVLSLLLPLLFIAIGGIGLPGGAVYVHTHLFRSRAQRAAVSLAGPAVNAVAAIALLIITGQLIGGVTHRAFVVTLVFFALLQFMGAILNLLPIPGLDGYGAIEPYLSPEFQRQAEPFKPFGMLGLFALLQVPTINTAFFNAVYGLFEFCGGNRLYAGVGYDLIRFWQTRA
ncbi:site-2 protease family protein [soil metagenome]|jgi:Zn-dependent protease